jgi:meiosis-specific transcription factor NDT80
MNTMLDFELPLTALASNSPMWMAPPSRSPALPVPVSPISTRDIYTSSTPQQLRRTSDQLSNSSSFTGSLRGVPLSPLSSPGYPSPNMDHSQLASSTPPLSPTEYVPHYELRTSDGQSVRAELSGRIEKGFFIADSDWTCYRRNYFSLTCSYHLSPAVAPVQCHIVRQGTASSTPVYAFAMSISAVVDGKDGKAIELVQHTPKRDKGPQGRPDRVTLNPKPQTSSGGMYGNNGDGMSSSHTLFDSRIFNNQSNSQQAPTEYTFDRIQFKQATANNGKRRAAQQYYHLLVEFYADTGLQRGENRYVKLAYRMSAPMVVRGRSPGHYQQERRGSATSNGPGGHGGSVDGGSSGYPSGAASARSDHMSLGGSSSMMQGNSYGAGYDTRNHHYGSSGTMGYTVPSITPSIPIEVAPAPIMSNEEHRSILDNPNYAYYPSPTTEPPQNHSSFSRTTIPSSQTGYAHRDYERDPYKGDVVSEDQRVKMEPRPLLPPFSGLTGREHGFSRFESYPESKGHFPTLSFQQEVEP